MTSRTGRAVLSAVGKASHASEAKPAARADGSDGPGRGLPWAGRAETGGCADSSDGSQPLTRVRGGMGYLRGEVWRKPVRTVRGLETPDLSPATSREKHEPGCLSGTEVKLLLWAMRPFEYTVGRMAGELGISEANCKRLWRVLCAKLGCATRAGAVAQYLRASEVSKDTQNP